MYLKIITWKLHEGLCAGNWLNTLYSKFLWHRFVSLNLIRWILWKHRCDNDTCILAEIYRCFERTSWLCTLKMEGILKSGTAFKFLAHYMKLHHMRQYFHSHCSDSVKLYLSYNLKIIKSHFTSRGPQRHVIVLTQAPHNTIIVPVNNWPRFHSHKV
jgi:hypothetical protein